jgi:hypothetical protein
MLSQSSLPVAAQILLGILGAIAVLAVIFAGFGWNTYSSVGSGLGRAAVGFGLGFALYFPSYPLRARGAMVAIGGFALIPTAQYRKAT